MQTTPFFTVALTTYNRSDLLPVAVESVLAQSYTGYELIIIDDASTDDTEHVAKELIKKAGLPPIHYHRQSTNARVDAARNQAIEQGCGEFIVYLDDDDRLSPDFLEQVHRALQGVPASVGFAIPGRRIYRRSETGDILLRESTFDLISTTLLRGERFFERGIGGGSGLVVRISAARAIGGWATDFKGGGDMDFMMRLAAQNDFLVIPAATLLIYNLDRPQVTHNRSAMGVALERLADQHADKLRRFPITHRRYYCNSARMFYAAKERTRGRRCMWKALRLAPFVYKTWRLFVLLEVSNHLPLTLRRRLFSNSRHEYQPT